MDSLLPAPFLSADWIYFKENAEEDEYSLYCCSFSCPKQKGVLYLAGDSDATVYLNGKLVFFSLSPSYPSHLIADKAEVDLQEGENQLLIELYYFGSEGFSSYRKGKAKLKFALLSQKGELLARSGLETLSCLHPHYFSHQRKPISPQLGYSFFYEAEGKQAMWGKSHLIKDDSSLSLRENRHCVLKGRAPYQSKHLGKGHYLLDFGRETVGFLDLEFLSPAPQNILFVYSEHHEEGKPLLRCPGSDDFSCSYRAKAGENRFLSTFRRLGLRYLEVYAEEDLVIGYIGIQEVVYPFSFIPLHSKDPLFERIASACVQTLVCCYHKHYEDCPSREQCLYAMDSYNQILAGLVCFSNKEQIRSSLRLFSYDERKDGLLSICSPSSTPLFIPCFSLFYVKSVEAYLHSSEDLAFLKDVYPKIQGIMNAFFRKTREDGLLMPFQSPGAWNFYEWAEGLDGNLGGEQSQGPDLIENALFLWTLPSYAYLQSLLGIKEDHSSFVQKNIDHARKTFRKGHAFIHSKERSLYTQYGNALALLAGYAEEDDAPLLASELMNPSSSFVKATLSTKAILYRALLHQSKGNAPYVLSDIKKTWGRMLQEGATTFYETEKGWKDFSGAGSLCHGWSATPLIFLKELGILE